MSFNNSGFNQLFVNNQIKNEILELYDANLGYVSNDYIDPALVACIEDVSVLQGQVADLGTEVDTKELKIQNSDVSQSFELTYGNSICEPAQPALIVNNPNFEFGYVSGSNAEFINTVCAQQFTTYTDSTLQTNAISITGSEIDMNNLEINNLNKLTLTSGAGTENQVLSLDASLNLVWKDDLNPDVSQWATFPAVQNVDVDNNNVTNVNDLVITNGATSFTQSVENIGGIDCLQIAASSNNKGIYVSNNTAIFAPNSALQTNTLTSNKLTLNGTTGQSLYIASANVDDPSFVVDIDTNAITSESTISMSGFGKISSSSLNPTFKQAFTYYVATNGDDSNSGSFEAPFQTIQAAINYAESVYAGTPQCIYIAAGSYTGNLTITKENITLKGGDMTCYNKDTRIVGSITVNIETHTNNMSNSIVSLLGLIIGDTVLDISDTPHCLTIKDCFLTANHALYQNTDASVDCRTYVVNNIINASDTSGTDPLIEFANGLNTFMYNNCTAKGVQHVLSISGISRTENFSFNYLECSSTSASAPAIVTISTSQYSSLKSLAYNVFSYSSNTAKSNDAVSTGVLMNTPAASSSLLYLFNNVFNLAGCPNTNKAVKSANSGSLVTFYANNYSSSSNAASTAYTIDGTLNVSKFALYAVV